MMVGGWSSGDHFLSSWSCSRFFLLDQILENFHTVKRRLLEDASKLDKLAAMRHGRRRKVLLETQPLAHYCEQPNGLTENSINGFMRVFVNLPQNIKDTTP
jgi:hypothetical protein